MVPSQVRDLLTDLLQRQREVEVPIAEPDDVVMEDPAEPCTSDSDLHTARTTIYFLLAFVAEHGRLEQQQGATHDLAMELNEVRASPTLPTFSTNVSELYSGAQSSPLTHFCRRFPV